MANNSQSTSCRRVLNHSADKARRRTSGSHHRCPQHDLREHQRQVVHHYPHQHPKEKEPDTAPYRNRHQPLQNVTRYTQVRVALHPMGRRARSMRNTWFGTLAQRQGFCNCCHTLESGQRVQTAQSPLMWRLRTPDAASGGTTISERGLQRRLDLLHRCADLAQLNPELLQGVFARLVREGQVCRRKPAEHE